MQVASTVGITLDPSSTLAQEIVRLAKPIANPVKEPVKELVKEQAAKNILEKFKYFIIERINSMKLSPQYLINTQ